MQRHSPRLKRDGLENDEDRECEAGVVRYLDLSGNRRLQLAIDWDPTALHLRYQTTREKICVEHSSVAECGATAAAVDLASCLRAFTSDERLEAAYHCAHCRSKQPATKKMQLWRAPPILVIHLKRFQFVNNKWIKSQKVVNFPFEDFDPTEFLAAVPQETILRHRDLRRSHLGDVCETDTDDDNDDILYTKHDNNRTQHKSNSVNRSHESRRQRLQSTSLTTAPVTDDNLQDFHQHHLHPEQDPFHLQYDLYAVVSHSGQLSGGHYVAYARNPSGAWLCYNDSACRDLPRQEIDPAAAYLLFYERRGLRYDRYLPEVSGPPPVPAPDVDEPDLTNTCAVM